MAKFQNEPLSLKAFFLGLTFFLSFIFNVQTVQAATLTHGAVLGALSDSSVKVWIRTDSGGVFKVEYKLTTDSYPGTITSGVSLGSGTDYTGVIQLSGLTANTAYDYRVLVDDVVQAGNGSSGTFTTLPVSGGACHYVFSTVGDFSSTYVSPGDFSFADILNTATPLFNLFNGDQIYGPSTGTKSDIEAYYQNNWASSSWKTFTKNTPSVFMWDDHEMPLSDNWDGGKSGQYPLYRQVADEYQFANNFDPKVPGETYFSFDVCDTSFFIADTRSYRSLDIEAIDSASLRMLGTAQMAHLKNWLKNNHAKFKFILFSTSTSDTNTSPGSTYVSYESERKDLYDFMKLNNIKNVLVLSGDQHQMTVNKNLISPTHAYYEFNATPFGSSPIGTGSFSGPDLVCKDTVGGYRYGLVSVDTTLGTPQVNWKGYRVVGGGADVVVCNYTITATSLSPAGPVVSSSNNQTFTTGAGSTAINTISITDAATATITSTNATGDIRVRIPSSVNASFDPSVTTATIGGSASAKVSAAVTYEESNKVAVFNVTTSFTSGNNVTLSGLKLTSFTGVSIPTPLGIDINNDGISDVWDNYTVAINNNSSASFFAESGQAFSQSQNPQSIKTLTVYDSSTPQITAVNDLRVVIPASFPMEWDTSDTSALIGGSASGKVSSIVSYPDAKTILVDVTSDFTSNDYITISGLSFKNFTSTASVSSLGLDVTGDGVADVFDTKSIKIVGASVRLYTGAGYSQLWSDPLNWTGQQVPVSGSSVIFDGTANEDVTVDYTADNLGSITLDTGYTSIVHFAPYAVAGNLGTLNVTGAITVNSGIIRFEGEQHIDSDLSTVDVDGTGYSITAGSVFVGLSGKISADYMGFPAGVGPGNGVIDGVNQSTGGSYGGRGGFSSLYTLGKNPSAPYGSSDSPISLGSGGAFNNTNLGQGGSGGGAIKISAGSIIVNGVLSADGESVTNQPGTINNRNAGGSGGSIWIASGSLSGAGVISANGGSVPSNTDTSNSGAGGGGRISFNGVTSYGFVGSIDVNGGITSSSSVSRSGGGHAGTVYFPSSVLSNYTLSSNLTLGSDLSQVWGNITIPSGFTLTLDSDEVLGTGYVLNATNVDIQSGGVLTASGKGYSPGIIWSSGSPSSGGNNVNRSGGSGYGGNGGKTAISYNGPGGGKYGSASSPVSLGTGSFRAKSGQGGGAIKLNISGNLIVNGTLSANGSASSGELGGASGGSIWVASGAVTGSGSIAATGSNTTIGGGAGGGGRISFNGVTSYGFTGSLNVSGGSGQSTGHSGHAGTIYFPDLIKNPSYNFILPSSTVLGNDISYTFGSLTIPSGVTLTLDSDLSASGGIGTGGIINATNLTIASGGALTADLMGQNDNDTVTTGRGATCISTRQNGGGHGGIGGKGSDTQSCPAITPSDSQAFGSSTAPITLGAGHLNGTSTYLGSLARGGGAIKLNVTDTLSVNGTLSSNGGKGSAGGSIWVITKNYSGATGTINANGGNAGQPDSGSGAGGRIRIEYVNKTYSGGTPAATGGTGTTGPGSSNGADGTVSEQSFSDTTPPVISNIQISSISETGATISWDSDEPGSSLVEYGTTISYGTSTSETDTSPRVIHHEVLLSGLTGSTTYHFRVKSKDDAGTPNEGVSSDQTFSTTSAPDATPPNISNIASDPTHNSVQITWDTDEDASSIVEYGTTMSYGTSTSETDTSPRVSSHTVNISGLSPSTTYHFKVSSKDAANNTGESTDQTFTTSAAPDVTPPTISNINVTPTHNSVQITWDTNENASSFVNYGTTISYGTTTPEIDTSPRVTSHTVDISGLSPSTTYHFRLNSNDASSNLGQSGDQTFTTSSAPDITPPYISNITATPTHNSVQIKWTTDENASSYVEYGTTASYGITTSEADTSPRVIYHTVNISSLSPSTTYHFRVNSKDASLNHAQSGDNTFTTSAEPDNKGGGGGGGAIILPPTPSQNTNQQQQQNQNTDQQNQEADPIAQKILSGFYDVGRSKDEVKILQTYLNKELGLKLGVDGLKGPKTNDAVKKWKEQNADTETPSGEALPSRSLVGYWKRGAKAEEIKEIQKYLNRALSLSLDADGIFGKMTEAALAKFQAQKGISPAIGIFGKITREYINAHPLSN